MTRAFVTSFVLACAPLGFMGCGGPDSSTAAKPPVRVTSSFESTDTIRERLTTCVDLSAIADATLSASQMRNNLGAKKVLQVGEKREALVTFDLSSIPASAAVDSSTLKLYVSDADGATQIDVHRATASWSESSVTFASFAQHFDPAVAGSIVIRQGNVQKSVDLTGLSKGWITGAAPNFGVLLLSTASEGATLVSREGGTAEQKPSLTVCYTVVDEHCSPSPCLNGAACENTSTGFACNCAAGYTGTTCETNINDCAANPCQNGGVCIDGLNGYSCTCAAGFMGTNCETNVDDCAPVPCQNGGVCADGVASYTCTCLPGYSGVQCETLIDNCASGPCQNGGACTNGVNSYSCTCATGFTGADCEINVDDCEGQPCHNGATCVDGINAFTCACAPDWGGTTCDVNLNSCSQGPCLNGATCTNGFGSYTCACATGFAGTNCEIDIDDCTPNPCLDGGICIDGNGSYTCQCQPGLGGSRCEITCDTLFYQDLDGDGFGGNSASMLACSAPAGFVDNNADCFDANADAHPGQTNFFTTDRGDGSFDFDCDGSEIRKYGRSFCELGTFQYGFAEFDVACGATGELIESHDVFVWCTQESLGQRIQPCH